MADDLVDFYKERFDRTDAKLDRTMETLETVTMRLGSLEEQIRSFRSVQYNLCERRRVNGEGRNIFNGL